MFRSCGSPTLLSCPVDRNAGACLRHPGTWLCSLESGSSTWVSVGCQHPCPDPESQDPVRARACKLLTFWSHWVSRLRACCLASLPQPCRLGLAARGPHAGATLPTSRSPDCQEPTADPAGWAGPASRTQREGPWFCVSCPESRQDCAYLIWWKLEWRRDFFQTKTLLE